MIARIRKSEVALHGAVVFGGAAVSIVFTYLFYVLLSRYAGVETYGEITSLVSALLVVTAPAAVAQLIVARLAADLEARGDRAAIRQLADTAMTWTAAVSGVAILAAIVERDAVARFFHLGDGMPVVITAVGGGLFALTTVQRGIFQGSHEFGSYSASMSIEGIVKMIGVPLAVSLGASGAMVGVLASQAVCCTYGAVMFARHFGHRRAPIALDRSLIARVASNVGVAQIVLTVLTYYDVPLIQHAFGSHESGLYAAAALVGRALIAGLVFVPTLLMPKVTARVAAGDSPLPLFGVGFGLCGAVVAIALIVAAIAPHFVVTALAGSAYAGASAIVLPYLVACGALALANVVMAYKIGLHRYDFVIPALLVAIGEIVVFAVYHPTLSTAVTVLMCGHCGVLAVALFRLNAPVARGDQSVKPAAVASL